MKRYRGSFSCSYDEPVGYYVVSTDIAKRDEVPVLVAPGFGEPLKASIYAADFLANETERPVVVFDEHPFTVCAGGSVTGREVAATIPMEVQKYLGFDAAHHVGHSTGGAGDVIAAADHPELFASLTVWSGLGLVRDDEITDESKALKWLYARNIAAHTGACLQEFSTRQCRIMMAGFAIAQTLRRNRGQLNALFYEAGNHDIRPEMAIAYRGLLALRRQLWVAHPLYDQLFDYEKMRRNIQVGRHCSEIVTLPGGHEGIGTKAGLKQLEIIARPLRVAKAA